MPGPTWCWTPIGRTMPGSASDDAPDGAGAFCSVERHLDGRPGCLPSQRPSSHSVDVFRRMPTGNACRRRRRLARRRRLGGSLVCLPRVGPSQSVMATGTGWQLALGGNCPLVACAPWWHVPLGGMCPLVAHFVGTDRGNAGTVPKPCPTGLFYKRPLVPFNFVFFCPLRLWPICPPKAPQTRTAAGA